MRACLFLLMLLLAATVAVAQQKEELAQPERVFIKAVTLFPNPATDYLSVKFEEPHARAMHVVVHNIVGNVLAIETELVDAYEVRVRVKELPAGYYFLALRDEQTQAKSTYKFLKR